MKSQALLFLLVTSSALAQGTFQNLGFELATIQPGQPPGGVRAADALPGWSPFVGTNQSSVYFDDPSAGSARIALLDTNLGAIEGRFSVFLQGGATSQGGGFYQADASIRQTGQVPAGTQSIFFKAQPGFMPLSVSLSGQSIPIFAVGTGPNYTLFGGDISAFGGQTVELEFAALPPNSNWTIDSIEFSSQAVPEPSVLTLVALGSVFLIWCVRHRTRLP